MRTIDADRLKDVLERNFGHTGGAAVLAQLIDAQPTVETDKVILAYFKSNFEPDYELVCVAENFDTAKEYVNLLKKDYPHLYDNIINGDYTGRFSYEEHDVVRKIEQ